MINYAIQSVIARDMAEPLPPWLKRVQIWALQDQFVVNCGYVSMNEATDLVFSALMFILNKRGRPARPVYDKQGEVCGMQW